MIYKKDNIYVIQGEAGEINSTLIEYPAHLVLIDSMYNSIDVKKLNEYILKFNKPLKFVINTHFHFDHFWGNKVISQKNTVFIAHQNYKITATSRVKSEKELKILFSRNRYPDITFEKELYLDDLYLFHTPGHTQDSICIYYKKNKLLIAGDTILGEKDSIKFIPFLAEGTPEQLKYSMERIMLLDFEIVIPGHFGFIEKNRVKKDMEYLNNLMKNKPLSMPDVKLIKKIHNHNKKLIEEKKND